MPTETPAPGARPSWRRGWPEALVALLAAAVFLGWLGSVDLWGKREQRAAAEAIDTLAHHHWLVAEIQGRPRLEKPPLPRWAIAVLMALTGRRDEWMVRLPGALCAVATVAMVYFLGRRMAGRAVGLAAALVLCSLGFFVGEMRQAGNDGPLAMFTTLALLAAWRLLDEGDAGIAPALRGQTPVRRAWGLVLYAALGLGFLTKGPVILMLAAVTVVPYLAVSGRLSWGLRRLADGWGLLLFAVLAASWPVAVLRQDPKALGVWLTEISEKTGVLQVLPHRRHALLAEQWPALMLPWSVIAIVALVLPFLPESTDRAGAGGAAAFPRPRSGRSSPLWFAWWWGMGNLGAFCLWAIAKASYYVPCMPGMALLIGSAWVRLAGGARSRGRLGQAARVTLQAHWVLIFVGAAVGPLVARPWLPAAVWPWSLAIAAALAMAVVFSAHAWRRGGDVLALAPIAAASVLSILIGYGLIAPTENPHRGHRALAQTVRQIVPPDVRALCFFKEIDEGLWFYLAGLDLVPVPETQPRYNPAYDLAEAYRTRRMPRDTIEALDASRQTRDQQLLIQWLEHHEPGTPYLLIRSSLYDRLVPELSSRVTPLFREAGLKRNELVLLQADNHPPLTATATSPLRR
jgi:4-amino-4-deoxy-L-arabinose transferase-like glycosyltransferase